MKNLYTLLFFCLAVTVSKAQIVNIPDANFKAKLLATTGPIGFNSSYNIVPIDANHDGQIQVSEAQAIYRLWVISSNISDLTGIESFTNLRELSCSNNNLTAINLTSLPFLRELNCASNSILNLNLTNLNLDTLYCNNNSISSLDLHNLTALKYVYCNNNSISSINVNGLSNLSTFVCSNNLLNNLTLTGLTHLFKFDCANNQLTMIDLTNLPGIYSINCAHNNLSNIDVSILTWRPWLQINCSYNPNLVSINIKDSIIMYSEFVFSYKTGNNTAVPPPTVPPPTSGINFEGTPNLQYFCADAGELVYVQNKINTSGYTNPNCQLSSTCEFLNPPTSNTTTASACGSYTWAVNGQTYTASGTYTVVNGNHTEILNLTIDTIQITTQPSGPLLCSVVGSTSSVSVVSNIGSPTYTWQYRVVTTAIPNPAWITINATNAGTVYSGYATTTLGITKTTTLPKANTQYRVMLNAGLCGSSTSDTVNLILLGTVKAGTISAPASGCVGNDITFSLSGYVGTAIQWQSALNSSASFITIPGATGSSYTATNLQTNSDKAYRAIVTNGPCNTTATTTVKTITISPSALAGMVTGGGVICEDSPGTLKIMGYVGKIQWQYSEDGATYFDAPKASSIPAGLAFSTTSTTSTAGTYMLTHITNDLYFRAKITNGNCASVYTNAVQYTIQATAGVGTISATNTSICPGTATAVTLTNATGTITWQKSINFATASPTWVSIANSNSLSITLASSTYNTAYRAMVTIGSCSTVYSNIVYVYLVAKPVAKGITANATSPSGKTASTALCTTDASKVLTIGAGYVGSLQWQKSITSTTAGFTDIAGATSASYTVTNPTTGANYYRVKVSNTCGVEVFSPAITVYYKECALKTAVKDLFDVAVYPNPFNENFNLDVTTSNEETIGVLVYDLLGKLIEQKQIQPNTVSGTQIGNNYPSGIYNVIVTQDGKTKTLRIIKR